MREITITDVGAVAVKHEANPPTIIVVATGRDMMEVSDGYHTMTSLYDQRAAAHAALFSAHVRINDEYGTMTAEQKAEHVPWRSKHHSDGTMFEGMFIVGIGRDAGEQITYHYYLSRWDLFNCCETLERAPEWDGHTPEDALVRLAAL